MEVVLDTNFIISCLLKKIDFLDELKKMGFKVVVPHEVIEELKDLKKNSKISHEERIAIAVAFEIFEKEKVKKIKLGGSNVDEGLIKKGKEGVYIATLDNGIKLRVPNKVVIRSDGTTVYILAFYHKDEQ